MADVVISDYVLDNGLGVLESDCTEIWVCSSQPSDYNDAVSKSLGFKNFGAGNAFNAPEAATPTGRKAVSNAIDNGTINGTGTVTAWAAVDSSANARLLVTGTLTGGVAVSGSGTFDLEAIPVHLSGAAPTYQGPGDIVSGALGWWGLRAYNAAARGSAAIRVKRSSDNTEKDIVTLTDGTLNVADTFLDGSTYTIVKMYDQSGNSVHLINTNGNFPTLTLNVINGKPAVTCASASTNQIYSTATITQAQPFQFSIVSRRTANFTTEQNFFGSPAPSPVILLGYTTSVNQIGIYAGSGVVARTASDNTFHAVQGLFNGTSSETYVDGSGGFADLGTTQGLAGDIRLGYAMSGLDGQVLEAGIWPGAFSTGNKTDLNTNQHDYWGIS